MIADDNNSGAPPESADLGNSRVERMLAFYAGALDSDETALISGRLENDPLWQKAGVDAQAMLENLKSGGVLEDDVPARLGERTSESLRAEKKRWTQAPPQKVVVLPVPFLNFRRAVAIVALCALPAIYEGIRYVTLAPQHAAMLWRADGEIASGSSFVPYLFVRDASSGKPVEGEHIAAYLAGERGKRTLVGEGTTDSNGTLSGKPWTIPEFSPGEYNLSVELHGTLGGVAQSLVHSVKLHRQASLALAPDRSQARPGETIRARAMLVSGAQQKPLANEKVLIDIFDPRGNRVAHEEKQSTQFGLAWAEFPLDTEAAEGTYRIKAEAAGLAAERVVEVKQYRLPPFRVAIVPDRPWTGPRDRIAGKVEAHTFDGNPVPAKGELRALRADGSVAHHSELIFEKGSAAFDIDALEIGANADSEAFRLEANLTDAAGRAASGRTPVYVSVSPVLVRAVAEGGELVPGVENRVFILAQQPDGTPARARLRIEQLSREHPVFDVETDAHGVATISLSNPKHPAEVLTITGDFKGVSGKQISVPVRAEQFGRLLIRTDKAVVAAGQKFKVSAQAGPETTAQTVTLALRHGGQTVASGGILLQGGRGETEIQMPRDVSGMLTLEASMLLSGGETWSDARAIVASTTSDIRVVASANLPKYRPGDNARLDFSVTDASGKGIPAAVSVVAVDQALLELTGEHPGLVQALQMTGVTLTGKKALQYDDVGGSDAAHAVLASVPAHPQPEKSREAHLQELVDAGLLDKSAIERLQRFVIDPKTEEDRQSRERIIADLKEDGSWPAIAQLLGIGEHETTLDTAARNLAEYQQSRREISKSFQESLASVCVVILALTILLGTGRRYEDRAEAIYSTEVRIPAVSLAILIVGFILFAKLDFHQTPIMLETAIIGSIIAAHAVLLRLSVALRNGNANAALIVATIVFDFVVVFLAIAAANENEVTVILVFIAVILFLVQCAAVETKSIGGVLLKSAAGLAVVMLLAAISLPSLLRSRMAANQTAVVATGKAFLEAHIIYSKSQFVSSHTNVPRAVLTGAGFSGPRLRWDFPETLVFAPQIVTDEKGHASYDFRVADSLTRWRVQADAIGSAGGTAWTQNEIVVTQPFSAELLLPTDVTAGDRIYVSAIVNNYTDAEREVELTLNARGALIEGAPARTLKVAAKSVASIEFPVRFENAGRSVLQLTAKSGAEADAVERRLSVLPDGAPVGFSAAALIDGHGELNVALPENAMPGTLHAALRVHPGVLAQTIDGLDAMLHEPYGCFEQTSSTTYPNIMILRYLKAHDLAKPEIEERARRFIAQGYQRLLGFEVGGKSGSFSLFGRAPASVWLTAYGLMEFRDMDAVYPVDPALLERMRVWLISKMNSDGSFAVDGYRGHEPAPLGIASSAYVVWALGEHAPPQSIEFLRRHLAEIENDSYVCALSANALLKADRAVSGQLAARLSKLALNGTKGSAMLAPCQQTLAWGYGTTAQVESSALGVLALIETGRDTSLAKRLIAGIQENRGCGGWSSTHATVLALKALQRASRSTRSDQPRRIVVSANGRILPPVELPVDDGADLVTLPIELSGKSAHLEIDTAGGPAAIEVTGEARVPWGSAAAHKGEGVQPFTATISYDAQTVQRNEPVLGTMRLSTGVRRVEVPMAEWGMPAGFSPESSDLDALKEKHIVDRWELSGRVLRLYLPDMEPRQTVNLNVRFYPSVKGEVQSHAGRAYEYYRMAENTPIEPVKFVVK